MSRQRMIDYHMARLRDRRAEIRLEAIHELVLLEAVEALEALETVFKMDEDAAVREAAREAGRKLFLLHKKQQKS